MIFCMVVVTSVAFFLWGTFDGDGFIVILIASLLSFGIPVIPGFLLASWGSKRGVENPIKRRGENTPIKAVGILATCLAFFIIGISAFGTYRTWEAEVQYHENRAVEDAWTDFHLYNDDNQWGIDYWTHEWWAYDELNNYNFADIPRFPGISLARNLPTNNSNYVMLIQERLNWVGTYQANPLSVDGIFGPLTEAAVIGFQNLIGMEANGVIDEVLWYEIFLLSNNHN